MSRIDCRDVSATEAARSPQVGLAVESMMKDGYAVLDHVLPAAKVQALHGEFNRRYARYFQDADGPDKMQVGHRRYQTAVEFAGGFADPAVYANPVVLAVIRQTLGSDAIIEAYGAIISLAHNTAQGAHRDSPMLFDGSIGPLLPCHAVTCALPLIDMDSVQGTTAVWPGSHRRRAFSDVTAPREQYVVPAGSCLLWDFRTYHEGTSNHSDRDRPMLFVSYARSWYRDSGNFTQHPGLKRMIFGPGFLAGVPADLRPLFVHAR